MSQTKKVLKRAALLVGVLVFAVTLFAFLKTRAQDSATGNGSSAAEQWEYLALAGPSTTNLTPTGNLRMRKEPNSAFAREAFVLEQHLDKLGANSWELVAVAGPPTDPGLLLQAPKITKRAQNAR